MLSNLCFGTLPENFGVKPMALGMVSFTDPEDLRSYLMGEKSPQVKLPTVGEVKAALSNTLAREKEEPAFRRAERPTRNAFNIPMGGLFGGSSDKVRAWANFFEARDAKCPKGTPCVDSAMLFDLEDVKGGTDYTAQQKELCKMCPLVAECLAVAMAEPVEPFGVWGGMSASDRKALARRGMRQRRAAVLARQGVF